MTESERDEAEPSDPRVEIIRKDSPFRGYFRVDRYQLRHRKFGGGWTEALTREVFERGHAAAVLPYDPARDEVVLIEQFRPGAYAARLEPWLFEAVAGIIGPGESPEDVVRRESEEEAGCTLAQLVHIGTYLMTPGGSSESIAYYCGRVDSTGLGGVYGLPDEGEDIKVHVRAAEDAFALLQDGHILNANAVIPLQWLALNREALRARWMP